MAYMGILQSCHLNPYKAVCGIFAIRESKRGRTGWHEPDWERHVAHGHELCLIASFSLLLALAACSSWGKAENPRKLRALHAPRFGARVRIRVYLCAPRVRVCASLW